MKRLWYHILNQIWWRRFVNEYIVTDTPNRRDNILGHILHSKQGRV